MSKDDDDVVRLKPALFQVPNDEPGKVQPLLQQVTLHASARAVRERVTQLETELNDALTKFEKDTGSTVTGVYSVTSQTNNGLIRVQELLVTVRP